MYNKIFIDKNFAFMLLSLEFISVNLFSAEFGLEFTRPEFYFYLNQTGVYTVEGTNDADDFNDLRVIVIFSCCSDFSINFN